MLVSEENHLWYLKTTDWNEMWNSFLSFWAMSIAKTLHRPLFYEHWKQQWRKWCYFYASKLYKSVLTTRTAIMQQLIGTKQDKETEIEEKNRITKIHKGTRFTKIRKGMRFNCTFVHLQSTMAYVQFWYLNIFYPNQLCQLFYWNKSSTSINLPFNC